MASLTGQTIASTYDALLKITDNGAITSSLKQITDGLGNNTPLFLSATTLYVNGNLRAGGALYDGNNEPGTNGQFLVSTGTGVDWQNIAESGLITGSGTNGFISKFTASGVIANSVIQESSSNIGIGISPTQKLHVSGNGLFTGTLTASNVSGSTSGTNTGDENTASIKSKLGLASAIQDGYLSSVDYESFTNKVPSTRTISINGETFDLSANRTYSVNVGVTSFNTRTGAVVLGSGDVTTALGYTPALNSRIMTINGVGYDLSADRTWSVGTVTSVGTSAPLTGGTITSTGTIGITQSGASADGYLSSTDWNTFNNKQAALGFTPENSANKGANNGYASLDGAGKVPSGQLPSYVDDVVEVANYAALPATGETGKIYITLDTNFVYRWSGSVYVKISEPNAVWGSITGTLSNQTDLQSALNAKVDNTRTITINGTASDLSANRTFNVGTVTSVSGTGSVSGLSLSGSVTSSGSLTLGGTLALTSGDVTTGLGYTPVTNARTLSINGTVLDLTANRSWSVGTVTSVGLDLGTAGTDLSVANSPVTSSGNITLNIPTASAANRGALSSTDWSTFNNKQNTLTLTTTGSSGASTLVGATLNIPTYTLSGLGGQPLLTNPVTGTGTSGYLTRFTGSTSVGNSVIFDNGTQVGIGTTSPTSKLYIAGDLDVRNSFSYFGSVKGYTYIVDDQINSYYSTDADAALNINFAGYNNGLTRFRDLQIWNGKGSQIAIFKGSNGNVGIGTSSPSTALHVIGAGTFSSGITIQNGNALTLNNSANSAAGSIISIGGGSLALRSYGQNMIEIVENERIQFKTSDIERMHIAANGNVGIGTTSPSYKLDIRNDVSASTSLEPITLNLFNQNDGGSAIYFSNGVGAKSKLSFGVEGTGAGTDDTYLGFSTGAGTSLNERMRIAANGNVGIGTTDPQSPLEVTRSSTGTVATFGIKGQTINPRLRIDADESNNTVTLNPNYSGSTSPALVFKTQEAERMRILASGNVGIGTASPTTGLVVNSRIQVTGNTAPSSGTGLELLYDGTSAGSLAFARGTGYIPNFMDGSQLQFLTSSSERMRITSGGNVLIGTTANGLDTARMYVIGSVSQTSLEVGYNGVTGTLVRFSNSQDLGGSITIGGGGVVAYNTLSDYRLKEDLKETNGLEKLSKLKVYDFKWKDSEDRMDGVLAHELQEVIPYAVVGEKDGEDMQGVDYSKLVPILVKAIQELKAELDELKNNK